MGDGEEACSLVGCHDLSGGCLDFDPVQHQGQPGNCDPE
jgi:hypothetical protein